MPCLQRWHTASLLLALVQDLRQCTGVSPSEDPVLLCITGDDMADPAPWWQHVCRVDPAMTAALYLTLMARCGALAVCARSNIGVCGTEREIVCFYILSLIENARLF